VPGPNQSMTCGRGCRTPASDGHVAIVGSSNALGRTESVASGQMSHGSTRPALGSLGPARHHLAHATMDGVTGHCESELPLSDRPLSPAPLPPTRIEELFCRVVVVGQHTFSRVLGIGLTPSIARSSRAVTGRGEHGEATFSELALRRIRQGLRPHVQCPKHYRTF
jgi:hypothetical protein